MGTAASKQRNVAVFLDMENLVGTHPAGKSTLEFGQVVTEIERIVRSSGLGSKTAMVRAYAHWGRPVMVDFQREILEYGIEPIQIFAFDKNIKNAADIELCVDALSVVHDAPWIDVVVIVSGDGGFVPLIRRLHALNKYVIVASTNTPNAGIVNGLLKSVADEYHQISMAGAHAAERTPPTPAAKTTTAVPDIGSQKLKIASVPPPRPQQTEAGVAELRNVIWGILKRQPELVVANKVDVAKLGQLLRKLRPDLNHKKCGSKTLGAFIKKHCALGVFQTHTTGVTAAGARPLISTKRVVPVQKNTAAIDSPSPEFLQAAVRKQFTVGALGKEVRTRGAEGLQLNLLGIQLKSAVNGFTAANAGFPRLQQVLEYALAGTDYRVVRRDPYRVAVVHAQHASASQLVLA